MDNSDFNSHWVASQLVQGLFFQMFLLQKGLPTFSKITLGHCSTDLSVLLLRHSICSDLGPPSIYYHLTFPVLFHCIPCHLEQYPTPTSYSINSFLMD